VGSRMNTIGGSAAGSSGTERVLLPVSTTKTTEEFVSQQPRHQVHNIKELRMAEIRGLRVSVGEEKLIMAIERANKALEGSFTSFEFSIHEGTKEIMVKVLDRDTGEVIREIPSEKILDLVAKMWELSGVFVDERR